MLKKLILILVVILYPLLLNVKNVWSFGLDWSNTRMAIDCGVPNSNINKCCRSLKFDNVNFSFGNPLIDIPLAPVRVPIELTFKIIGGVITGAVDEVLKQTKDKGNELSLSCVPGSQMSVSNRDDPDCICILKETPTISSLIDLCKNIKKDKEKQDCLDCLTSNNPVKKPGIWTAIGCVYPNTSDFIQQNLLGIGVSIGGITALLCIIYSAFMMQISQGNPEKIKKAQELLTSCITGLILIIFSIFILRLIGVSILGIPGFS